ncbi:MAG: acyltransferase [Gammaproteobacteria bacterium]|nr:acyltransferase [Gammaproteobacteria bacterium]MBU1623519.1 acyltransferase [Gammaproteobacteria bacterium]
MKQQQYSFEIQGLRGISILAVMLFHFGGVPLPGGYAGVDMFFVISGYVITQLIVREHRAGRFTLSGFYKNRVIRLLPNLFAMIVATIVIGYFLLLPFDFGQFGKSLQFTAVYLTNLVFARQQGYFDLSREVKPLLHTWSLSIEEQFYLFFPLLLVMLWRFRYRRWMVFGLLFVCSLAWKVWVIQQDHISSFFSFPGRIWEFMIGAMAAQVSDDIRQRFARNEWLSVLSILFILLTFLFLDERIPYAGVWVAASCFATAVLILSSHGTRVGAVLSGKQLVFAGALSYSLYLWHWPLLVLLRNLQWDISQLLQLPLLIAGTFAVAYPAWRFIEAPLHRNKDRFSARQAGLATLVFAIFVIAAGGYIYGKGGMEERFPTWVKVRQNLQDFDLYKAAGIDKTPWRACEPPVGASGGLSSCAVIGEAGTEAGFLLIGDSHAFAWAPAFDVVARKHHQAGIYSSLPGCPPIFGVHSLDMSRDMCEADLERKLAGLLDHFGKVSKVYLVAHWNMYAEGNRIKGVLQRPSMLLSDSRDESLDAQQSQRVMARAFGRTVEFFERRGIAVTVMLDVPTLPSVIQQLSDGYEIAPDEYSAQGRFMTEMAGKLAAEHPNLNFAAPGEILCKSGACATKLGSDYLYSDNNHISAAGAFHLLPLVDRLF